MGCRSPPRGNRPVAFVTTPGDAIEGPIPAAADPGQAPARVGQIEGPDPARGFRVRVHPSTRIDGDDDVTIDPGSGPAGAADRAASLDRPALRWLDAGHATSGTGEASHRVLLEPPGAIGPTGRREREVVVDGWRFVLEVEPERLARLREKAARGSAKGGHGGPLEVRAIIPGRVVAISVAVGDQVAAGQQLLIIEAMKMQNELRAPRAGVVERLAVASGQTVDLGTLLLVLR